MGVSVSLPGATISTGSAGGARDWPGVGIRRSATRAPPRGAVEPKLAAQLRDAFANADEAKARAGSRAMRRDRIESHTVVVDRDPHRIARVVANELDDAALRRAWRSTFVSPSCTMR